MGACQKQICGFCRNISQNIVLHITIFSYSQHTKLFKGFWNILMSFSWDQCILFKRY